MGPGADLDTVSTAQLHVLGAGTTIGVAAWALCQVPPVLRLGFRWHPVLAVRDPAVRRAVRAGTYGLAFFFVTQLGFVATLVLANRVPGGVVAFQIAFAFYELPNALLAFPVATAVFPALARRAAEGQVEAFGRLLSRGMRSQGVLIVPAAVGVFVVARPLIEAVFARGATSEAGAGLVAVTLAGMALGLPAYALTQTLVRAFYARHETRPPVVVNAAAVGTYVVAAVTATVVALPAGEEAMGVIGVTHAAGQWVGLGVGAWILARRVPQWPVLGDARSLGASVARSALMGVAVWAVLGRLGGTPTSLRAAAGIAAGAVAYGLLSFRVPEVGETIRLVRRRGSADGS
jgi:putative peptidoglycan lipid II flippase